MTVLVTGGEGQLGRALAACSHPDRPILALSRSELDVIDPQSIAEAVERLRPAAVVNAAAMTDVDGAENQRDLALAINQAGAGNVAAACRRAAVPMLQVSTNYVFDGEGGEALAEEAPARPLSVYGQSKLDGERATRTAYPEGSVILRTSTVFSVHGSSFVRSILAAAETRERLSVVDDQTTRPTAADDLAAACLAVLEAVQRQGTAAIPRNGVLHFGGEPGVSFHALAQAIIAGGAARGRRAVPVDPVASNAVPRPAMRPANGVLACGRYLALTGRALPDWRTGLDRVLDRLLPGSGDDDGSRGRRR